MPVQTNTNPAVGSTGGVTTISVGFIAADGRSAFENAQATVWADYEIRNRYESDRHVYMMGISSPDGFQGSKAAFVQLASPTLLWIVDWTASRIGGKPTVPDTDLKDANWIFLDEHLEPGQIIVMADGTSPVYRISGTYFYGHKSPNVNVNNNTQFARPPFITNSFSRDVPDSMFQGGLATVQ